MQGKCSGDKMFKIVYSNNILNGRLIYIKKEYSFDTTLTWLSI